MEKDTIPEIVAKVGDREFTREDFQKFLTAVDPQILRHFMAQKDGFHIVMEEMTHQELMLLYAKERHLQETEEFQEKIKEIETNLLKNYAYEKVLEKAKPVDPEEIRAYFELNKASFKKPHVNASHILVKSEEEAHSIYEQLQDDPSLFETLAQEKSTCPSGKKNGGNLGDFTKGQMVEEFENAVFKMQEGEISPPVYTKFGYHIIKMNKLHSIEESSYETAAPEIAKELERQHRLAAYQEALEELKKKHPVEIYI